MCKKTKWQIAEEVIEWFRSHGVMAVYNERTKTFYFHIPNAKPINIRPGEIAIPPTMQVKGAEYVSKNKETLLKEFQETYIDTHKTWIENCMKKREEAGGEPVDALKNKYYQDNNGNWLPKV